MAKKAFVIPRGILDNAAGTTAVKVGYTDTSTDVFEGPGFDIEVNPVDYDNVQDFITFVNNAVLAQAVWRNYTGFTAADITWLPIDVYKSVATTSVNGLMSAADKLKLDGVTGAAYKSYQAVVSQTGTSAPSATVMHSDFSGVTLTWARTGVGVYTLTANSAIFTANKTAFLITDPSNALWVFSPVITSTTVITLTTSVMAILAIVLGVTNTDALLSGNLVEVRVYP